MLFKLFFLILNVKMMICSKSFYCVFVFILLSFLSVSAQKEVYFDTIKTENIKVQSLQGFETNVYILFEPYNKTSIIPDVFIGYFNEKRIGSTITLISTIGIRNAVFKRERYDLINNVFDRTGKYYTAYYLTFEISLEPRWYLNYKNRFQNGTAKLNSGLFLSMPLTLSSLCLRTPDGTINNSWLPLNPTLHIALSPRIGYRQAICKSLFIEGMAALSGTYSFNGYDLYGPIIEPSLNFKAAYTFN